MGSLLQYRVTSSNVYGNSYSSAPLPENSALPGGGLRLGQGAKREKAAGSWGRGMGKEQAVTPPHSPLPRQGVRAALGREPAGTRSYAWGPQPPVGH